MKLSYKKLFASLFLAAVAALPSLAHATNGMNQIGYGVKSKGMGGVGVALPQDSIAAATNPAGMVMVGDRFDLGIDWVSQDAHARFHDQYPEHIKSHDPLWFPEAGINWKCHDHMSVGLTIFVPGSFKTKYHQPFYPLGITNPRSEYTQLFITPSFAWQITDRNAVGIAVNFAMGWLNIHGIEDLAVPSAILQNPGSVKQASFTNQGWQKSEGLSVRLGWIGRVSDCFQVGASYQTKTWMGKFRNYQGFLGQRGEFDLPSQWLLGAAWIPAKQWVVSLDLGRILWSDSKMLEHNRTQTGLRGGNGGPGFGWNDQNVIKIGAAWSLNEHFTLRIGYNHARQPIDNFDTMLNTLTQVVIEDHFTGGFTFAWEGNEVSMMYWYGIGHELKGRQSSPPDRDVDLDNRQNSVGISYGRHF